MKNLVKAVIQVMKEVKGMEKNSKVGSGRNTYNGTKDQDVKEVFNEALEKNGLCMFPTNIDEETQIDRWDAVDYNGKPTQKQSIFTKVKTTYLLAHESGESIELSGYGHGVDTQDKGAGKATTYALKNALLYTFLTPVGNIDDSDTEHSEEKIVPNVKPKITPDAYQKAVKAISDKKVTLDQIKAKYSLSEEQEKQLKAL